MEGEEYGRIAGAEAAHWWYGATRTFLGELLAPVTTRATSPTRILDVGVGTGATGGWLATIAPGGLYGVDLHAPALAMARERYPFTGLAAADALALPFAPDTFDVVQCVTVLYHAAISDPAAVVREYARVVRPGGVVCLLEPGVRRLRRGHDRMTHTGRRFARSDLVALAEGAGLVVERATGLYTFLVPPAAVKAIVERRRTTSDVDEATGAFGGVLAMCARAERAVLRRMPLPFGLSVALRARRPA